MQVSKESPNWSELCSCEDCENGEKDKEMFLDRRNEVDGDDEDDFLLLKLLEQVFHSIYSRLRTSNYVKLCQSSSIVLNIPWTNSHCNSSNCSY